jgi:hypothetical protein
MNPHSYALARTSFGVALLMLWTLTRRGQDGVVAFVWLPLLSYGTLQLFEGLGRYVPEPTLQSDTAFMRELKALGFAIAASLMSVMETDSGAELTPIGQASMLVGFTAFFHFLAASTPVKINRRLIWTRLAASGGLGVVIAYGVASHSMKLHFVDVLGVPLGAAAAGLLTMGASFRAWQRFQEYRASVEQAGPIASLRQRVDDAAAGRGPEILLQMKKRGARVHQMSLGKEKGRKLEVPIELVPDIEVGQWALVRGCRIVTASRGGGDGYRGTDTYERIDGCEDVTLVGSLPLPPLPERPIHPVLVELALSVGIVILTMVAIAAAFWALG